MSMTTVSSTRPPLRSAPLDVNAEIQRWRDRGDEDARDRVFERFLPLARRLSTRYRNPHEPADDLTQVAAIGLLGAIDRFDPVRGARFESFAIPTILGELKRYFRDTGWSAHVPRRPKELALVVDRAAGELAGRDGRSPSVRQLAEHLRLSVEDVLLGLEAGQAHYSGSLDAPAGTESAQPQSLGEQLGGVDDHIGLVDAKLSLGTMMSRLPHRERTAVQMRLAGDVRQCDIARAMGCSQMQVSRLLRSAAARMRSQFDPDLNFER